MEAWDKRNAEERTWRIVDAVVDIAGQRDITPSRVALAWLAAKPAVTSVILGARTQEQLADNLGAASLSLSPSEMDKLDAVSAPTFSDYPYGTPGIEQRSRKIDAGR